MELVRARDSNFLNRHLLVMARNMGMGEICTELSIRKMEIAINKRITSVYALYNAEKCIMYKSINV